ncbi:MAG: monovalent cation/H(+) antiporter subunit G [Verrucomicrobia bacterium]|nr:MAG: monovalent cation/H(+) antiporter subunit G [Verrucomicrobiota bacterium]
MIDFITAACCLLGCLSILLASVGVLRFPDFFARTHPATKASAFGLLLLLVAFCVHFPQANQIAKAVFSVIAVFLTLPVASQALADAARSRKSEEQDHSADNASH